MFIAESACREALKAVSNFTENATGSCVLRLQPAPVGANTEDSLGSWGPLGCAAASARMPLLKTSPLVLMHGCPFLLHDFLGFLRLELKVSICICSIFCAYPGNLKMLMEKYEAKDLFALVQKKMLNSV